MTISRSGRGRAVELPAGWDADRVADYAVGRYLVHHAAGVEANTARELAVNDAREAVAVARFAQS